MQFKTKNIVQSALIAALYVIFTLIANALGLANGIIQVRISEALCILPVFTVSAIPGLFLGCLISNIITGCALWDILLGSVATLIGAVGTYLLRKRRILSYIPPIAANTIIVPLVLSYVYNFEGALWYFAITVCIGEIISCGLLGEGLYRIVKKNERFLF